MDKVIFSIDITGNHFIVIGIAVFIFVSAIVKAFRADSKLTEAHQIRLKYENKNKKLDEEKKAIDGQKERLHKKLTELENMYLIQKNQLLSEITLLNRQKKIIETEYQQRKERLKKDFEQFANSICSDQKAYQIVSTDKNQNRQEIAKLYADIICARDMTIANQLLLKDRPAIKAADEIKAISAEKRNLIAENKALNFQIKFYESLFPWLEEFKEVPIDDAIAYATQADSESNDEYERLRNWLSPEEYQSLGTIEKYQLALNRWKRRKKNDWEIGIEYERYIGYCLEQQGYKVEYFGATMGLGDMGRDLLATKGGVTLVIQCKRWAKDKTIHEKHICQLYGSVAVLATQNPNRQYKGVFITSAGLSDTAKLFADYSSIQYVEACPMENYPVVKCNLSNTGEKIYHLPFDQQYDRVVISPKKGEFFAMTVADAEAAGFRRAFRWHSN